jgi:hypothetical protein
MPLANEVYIECGSGERREDLPQLMGIFEVRDRFTRDGVHPMVTLDCYGTARVSFPSNQPTEEFPWE